MKVDGRLEIGVTDPAEYIRAIDLVAESGLKLSLEKETVYGTWYVNGVRTQLTHKDVDVKYSGGDFFVFTIYGEDCQATPTYDDEPNGSIKLQFAGFSEVQV
jgi:hypothetical protein